MVVLALIGYILVVLGLILAGIGFTIEHWNEIG